MNIDWQAPFQLAWNLGLFLIGSILVVIIVGFALLLIFAIVKTFFDAFRRARKQTESKRASEAWLKRKAAAQERIKARNAKKE